MVNPQQLLIFKDKIWGGKSLWRDDALMNCRLGLVIKPATVNLPNTRISHVPHQLGDRLACSGQMPGVIFGFRMFTTVIKTAAATLVTPGIKHMRMGEV